MSSPTSAWKTRIYHVIFVILTFLCWSPLLYGSYGETGLIFSMPSWAAIALGIGAIFFVLQWFYLFASGMTLTDDNLGQIVDELHREAARLSSRSAASK